MAYKNYYAVLGLERTATQDEVKRAYRKLARKFHPDVSKEAGAEDKFKELGEAYEVLGTPETRAQYDQIGERVNQQQAYRTDAGQQGFYQAGNADVDFEELINSIFGKHYQQHANQGYAPAYDKGRDIHAQMEVSLEDSLKGVDKTIQLKIPKSGSGHNIDYEIRTIKVKIPKGVQDKQQIRLKGQGGNLPGQPPADIYLQINLLPHPWFKLQDKDIYLELPVTPWEAALGATIKVPTLDGVVNLTIPKSSPSGKKMRLKGRGLPGPVPGDQYVILDIVIPPKENDQLTKLYQDMANATTFNPREKLGMANG